MKQSSAAPKCASPARGERHRQHVSSLRTRATTIPGARRYAADALPFGDNVDTGIIADPTRLASDFRQQRRRQSVGAIKTGPVAVEKVAALP
jgi:hypothetical protein